MSWIADDRIGTNRRTLSAHRFRMIVKELRAFCEVQRQTDCAQVIRRD